MTFAELDEIVRAKRFEEWDRAAFVSSFAINANPYRKEPFVVRNPLDQNAKDYIEVPLEQVEFR